MPEFDLLPMDTAFATLEQAQIVREYRGYIDKLEPGQMGRLTPADGETLRAVRRRIGVAARVSQKTVEIKQTKDEGYLCFLTSPELGVGTTATHRGG